MQEFKFLTLNEKIVVIRPYNPFAPGILERINAYPASQQLTILKDILIEHKVESKLEVLGTNGDYNVVLYSLMLIQT